MVNTLKKSLCINRIHIIDGNNSKQARLKMVEQALTKKSLDTSVPDKKGGVPGFSKRLNFIFDLAGAPAETRLSWGAKKWAVVPNTVKNWVKGDIPPQNFGTLELVVNDLLNIIQSNIDKTAVIGWLYAGGKNPFLTGSTSTASNDLTSINHFLQMKIFNKLYEIAKERGVDINLVDESKVNWVINSAYLSITSHQEINSTYDVNDEIPLLNKFIDGL